MKKILIVAGARPNFMKIAPLMLAFKQYTHSINAVLIHTGQHYDESMSKTFFEQQDIPKPDIILKEYEKIMSGGNKKGTIPPLWDGHSAERIVEVLDSLV